MSRFLGMIGAHRTGKTTLARSCAQKMGVSFYETNLSESLRQMGVDPQADLPFHERLVIQNLILDLLNEGYAAASMEEPIGRLIVTDRTPLDVLGYSLSEVQRTSLSNEHLNDKFERHVVRCIESFNAAFVMGVLVRPGIPLVDDRTKAPANASYQAHVSACMVEACLNDDVVPPIRFLPTNCLQNDSRVTDVLSIFHDIMTQRREQQASDEKTSASLH